MTILNSTQYNQNPFTEQIVISEIGYFLWREFLSNSLAYNQKTKWLFPVANI